jgi:hypothetical protein
MLLSCLSLHETDIPLSPPAGMIPFLGGKMKKFLSASALDRSELTHLEQLPNIGPAIAADFRRLGLKGPQDLLGRDPYALFEELCRLTGKRHDGCLLDTFIAAVRFMGGEPARPWWAYTSERKRRLASNPDEEKTV